MKNTTSEQAPDTSHLGEPFAKLKLRASELTLWQQDDTTYPFLWHIVRPDESGFASGVALCDVTRDDFDTAAECVRVLQVATANNVRLDTEPEFHFLQCLVFTAVAVALEFTFSLCWDEDDED